MKAAKENQIKKNYLFQQKTDTRHFFVYEKFGFAEVPLDDCIYERADIKMEKLICNRSLGIFIPNKAIFFNFT
jgi:hypothetical protein